MRPLLALNEWVNRRAPWIKRVVRPLLPKRMQVAFGNRKFAATIDHSDYRSTFRDIYLQNWWGDPESRSGFGSRLDRTASVRAGLSAWFKEKRIRSLFDAPCGDFNWMKELLRESDLTYSGGDLVPELIEANRAAYPKHDFRVFDILTAELPEADAWLCRDVLIHLPNAQIASVLERFRASKIRYFLTTHFEKTAENRDIRFGEARPINLCFPPFNWPPPSHRIYDGDDNIPDRHLAVWENPAFRPGS